MNITAGVPLKDMFDGRLIGLIGKSFAAVHGEFDTKRFKAKATAGLADLTMMQRSAHIAAALAAELPDDFQAAAQILIRSLGPSLDGTEGNGLRPFFYMPHASFVGKYGVQQFKAGMAVNYEITRRFTAEFSVRPFLMRHEQRALALLKKWTKDPDVHVRRLCSEGTRPRLPWASRLPAFQANPELALPILEALKDDEELYVRRSVANHLGDLCKDHPEWVFALCARWVDELKGQPEERVQQRHWMVRHALRHPAKKGVEAALELRERAKR